MISINEINLLQAQNEEYRKQNEQLQQACKKYEQECEELKTQIETYSKILESSEFNVALTDVRTGEREIWRKLGNKAQKYKQALDDIKECIDELDWTMLEYTYKRINDIISKAKDGNDDKM